jgi:uncharacterized membrane protein
MKIRTIAINGIVAALYIVIMTVINPFAFLVNQFRIPEMLNHLIVFNKKYFIGIVIGVFISNLLFSPLLPLDLIYGVGHSIISLGISILLFRYIKNSWIRLVVNSLVFSFMMFIIAQEIVMLSDVSIAFIPLWLSLFVSELLVMGAGIPVMYLINKRINFNKVFEDSSYGDSF